MRNILLDTSVIIDFLRRKDKENSLLYELAEDNLYASIITHTELFAGKSVWEKEEGKSVLEKLFSGITIVPLNRQISEKAGFIKAHHQNISLADCIIAASAIENNSELATLNIVDFKDIDGIRLISLRI